MNTLQVEILQSKTGDKVAKINNLYIHSVYNPKIEAKKIATTKYKPRAVHILFGNGFGYTLEELCKLRKFNEKILVIEPIYIEYFPIVELENVFYLTNYSNEELESFLDSHIHLLDQAQIIEGINYPKIYKQQYIELLDVYTKIGKMKKVLKNTINQYSSIWLENFLSNITYLSEDLPINDLEKKYDYPIVVASGGPSLTKQLPLLKKFRDKIILVSSGSTINSLLKNSVIPDYVVSIDGGEANFNHFKNAELSDIKLIYGVLNNKKIRPLFSDKHYYFIEDVSDYSKDVFEEQFDLALNSISGGGTVATYAMVIAALLTTNKVALIGQDLAYTNGFTHAQGNVHFNEINENFIKERQLFEVEAYNGGYVYTDPAFYAMRQAFLDLEDDVQSQVFNCTEGGIKLGNYKHITFESFLEKYATEITDLKQSTISNRITDTRITEFFEEEKKKISHLKTFVNQSLLKYKQNKLLNIDKLNNKINDLMFKSSVSIIVNEITIKAYDQIEYAENIDELNKQKNINMLTLLLERADVVLNYIEEVQGNGI